MPQLNYSLYHSFMNENYSRRFRWPADVLTEKIKASLDQFLNQGVFKIIPQASGPALIMVRVAYVQGNSSDVLSQQLIITQQLTDGDGGFYAYINPSGGGIMVNLADNSVEDYILLWAREKIGWTIDNHQAWQDSYIAAVKVPNPKQPYTEYH